MKMENTFQILKNNTYEFGARLSMAEVQNPYPNEHAARLRDPADFDAKTFRRTAGGTIFGKTKVPSTIGIILGKLKGKSAPADSPIVQALRFPIKNWTESEARKWLKDNSVKFISFEPAKEEKKDSNARAWFEIKNAETESEVYILDEIGGWGITAKAFVTEFKKIKSQKIKLHINSPGGSVTQGMTIYNIIRDSGKDVQVHVDGLAASIASVIAMAGNKIFMPANALMMIHESMVTSIGRAEDHRRSAEILEKINGQITDIYAEKSGQDKEDIRKKMKDETWFTGKEALEYGLVDETTEPMKAVALVDVEKMGFKNTAIYDQQIKPLNQRPVSENKNLTQQEVPQMDLNQLKLEHPQLADALIEEGKAAGRIEGATAERSRIQAILQLNAADAKDIVTAAINKADETAGTVAIQILKKRETTAAAAATAATADNQQVLEAAAAIVPATPDAQASAAAKTKTEEDNAAKEMAEAVNRRNKK